LSRFRKLGGFGCALSYLALWRQVIAENKAMTICEDDAIFNVNFAEISRDFLGKLYDNYDMVWWRWNFDAPILYDIFLGGVRCISYFSQDDLLQFVSAYKSATFYPALHRLYELYGTLCYSVSPRGARKLIERLFPLGSTNLFSAALNRTVDNIGFDNVLNGLHRELTSFVCYPPLAISKHDVGRSTTLNPKG
jgi:glycosyl transferase family 25